MQVAFGVAALALVGGVVAYFAVADRDADSTAPVSPQAVAGGFVGSERCATCHAAEYRAWQGSQHQRAMQPAGHATVLGDFDDATFTYGGVTTRFFRRDGKHYVRTDGPDGALADFEVKYTFGVDPLQQYLLELPRGRLQALSIAWDARPVADGGQRWFHLYPDERIDYRDELHWTRRQQNWNFMCADCHSTNVVKAYDATTDSYATRFDEISVGCEACHGPGSTHLEWARVKTADPSRGLTVRLDERRGVAWTRDVATNRPRRSVPRTTQREIEVCAQCHARRAQLAEGYRAGAPFTAHYLPTLIEPSLYHLDGQQQDEVYVWGSWLQSRMHRAGVTCSDCHDPHTQQLRAPGNAVCAQCHDPARFDARAHHRHPEGSPGAQCVACHMPSATYMVVDPRRDHSMRVPRPDQTVSLGVPNACGGCHEAAGAAWAAAQVRGWLGRDAAGIEQFAAAFRAGERGGVAAGTGLRAVALDESQPGLVRASALQRLASLQAAADLETLRRTAGDADALVRLGAVRLAEAAPPPARVLIARLLDDPVLAVRVEAARALAGEHASLPPAAWRRAADEYVATLRYNADRPESLVALGGFHAALGQPAEADAAFAAARRLDPAFEPAYVNAADALRARGRDADAVGLLEQGLRQVPNGASLHHALGLAQVRLQRYDVALASLERAALLGPEVPRFTYVYAVALHSTGRPDEAVVLLERTVARWPGERDSWLALASFQADAGRHAVARRTVARMLERFPGDADVEALARQLQ